MKLRPRDVISYEGRDYIVDGVLVYKLGAQSLPLARAVDGSDVLWVEPLLGESDDRLLLFREVRDVTVGTPPPPTIAYRGNSYVPRLSGTATISVDGAVSDRTAGPCEVWRYRAAGDVFLQVERWPHKVVTLAGESVHRDMIEVLPAP
ncbi:MAG TPA: DUF4178 domain-containing protein [Polyangia bacterium]